MAEENREEQLNKIGRALLRSTPADDGTIEKIAVSPFLYAKIRARVAEGQAKSDALPPYRSLLTLLARRAIPAFALLALLAMSSYFFTSGKVAPPSNGVVMNDVVFPKLEQNTPPTACNIANRLECVVSTDDVVAILVHKPESGNR